MAAQVYIYAMQKEQDFYIRDAAPADVPQLLSLVRELALYERAPEEVTITEEEFHDAGFGKSPVWWCLVAVNRADDSVVGFALWYIRFSTWKGSRMYLEDLYVQEEHRGKAIGAALMDKLRETAADRGFGGVQWQVLDWNEPAINFYRKYEARFDAGWINVSIPI